MAIDDILFNYGDFIMELDSNPTGIIASIDFPWAVWIFIPYHGYITKSRLIGGN